MLKTTTDLFDYDVEFFKLKDQFLNNEDTRATRGCNAFTPSEDRATCGQCNLHEFVTKTTSPDRNSSFENALSLRKSSKTVQ